MCLADVGRVRAVASDGATASVEIGDDVRAVSLAVLAVDGVTVAPGEWVMCHLGLATRLLEPAEVAEIYAARTDTRGPEQ